MVALQLACLATGLPPSNLCRLLHLFSRCSQVWMDTSNPVRPHADMFAIRSLSSAASFPAFFTSVYRYFKSCRSPRGHVCRSIFAVYCIFSGVVHKRVQILQVL